MRSLILFLAVILSARIALAAPPTPGTQTLRSESGQVNIETGSAKNIELSTNNTKRWIIDGTTGALSSPAGAAVTLGAITGPISLTGSIIGRIQTPTIGATPAIIVGPTTLDTDLTTSFYNIPGQQMTLVSDPNNGQMQLVAYDGGNGYSNFGARLDLLKTRSTSVTGDANAIVQSADVIGDINFWGAAGTTYKQAAGIKVTVDATPGAADMPGAMDFQLTPDGSASSVSVLKLSNDATATFTGNIAQSVAGKTITVKAGGAAATSGTFVCNGVTGVVVSTTNASASMVLAFSPNTIAGTAPIGAPYVSAFTAGTSFTVKCSVAGETSTYNWAMIKTN